MTKIIMSDQRSVTNQLHDLIRLANQEGLYDAVDWIRDRMVNLPPISSPLWDYTCNDCGENGSDEGNEVCLYCGSLDVTHICLDIDINLLASARDIATMLVLNVCSDPAWIHSAQVKVMNIALRYAKFSARITDFRWNPIGNAQVLGIKDVKFKNDQWVEDRAPYFINEILYKAITKVSLVQAVNVVAHMLDNEKFKAEWVHDLRNPINENQVVNIIGRYLLNDYQVYVLGNLNISLEDVLNGRFSNIEKPLVVDKLFKPWNNCLGEELFKV